MITYKTGQTSKKEKEIINNILMEYIDLYKDVYITKNNLRLFLKENSELMYESLSKGDKIVFDDNLGLIFIYGYSDKASRKYLKILAKDDKSADKLLKVLSWNLKIDLYAKIKKTNPIRRVLERNGFRYFKDRGAEVLLYRQTYSTPSSSLTKDKGE